MKLAIAREQLQTALMQACFVEAPFSARNTSGNTNADHLQQPGGLGDVNVCHCGAARLISSRGHHRTAYRDMGWRNLTGLL
ncbi:MAG: hypothetical protein QMD99_23940 [Rhizobiaceae bacterium]|nr:hypothetical protein [Rhizobiaceae bacterium]